LKYIEQFQDKIHWQAHAKKGMKLGIP